MSLKDETFEAVQTRLKELGWYAGKIDGQSGPLTETAVIDFKRAHGLNPRVFVGPITLTRLFDPNAEARPKPKPSAASGLPWLAPVGRLDKASEGLLLLCNDPPWAAQVTAPATGPAKTYHVQVDCVPDEATLAALLQGVVVDDDHLAAQAARLLRSGQRTALHHLAASQCQQILLLAGQHLRAVQRQ